MNWLSNDHSLRLSGIMFVGLASLAFAGFLNGLTVILSWF